MLKYLAQWLAKSELAKERSIRDDLVAQRNSLKAALRNTRADLQARERTIYNAIALTKEENVKRVLIEGVKPT